ncbi:MAG: RNA polymerase sigma factor (sigma-70 family) [Cyclobacteriaceae bacterium]
MTEEDFVLAIKKHSGIIHKILYLYLDSMEEREDMAQEIQLQAWKAIGRFRGDSQFSTWLYRVALNTVFTFNRKKRIKLDPIDQHDFKQENNEPSDQSEKLIFEIKKFSEVDKTIITLHLEDYDNGEIAEILGLTKNNVTVKIHRIKELLKFKLNPKYGST